MTGCNNTTIGLLGWAPGLDSFDTPHDCGEFHVVQSNQSGNAGTQKLAFLELAAKGGKSLFQGAKGSVFIFRHRVTVTHQLDFSGRLTALSGFFDFGRSGAGTGRPSGWAIFTAMALAKASDIAFLLRALVASSSTSTFLTRFTAGLAAGVAASATETSAAGIATLGAATGSATTSGSGAGILGAVRGISFFGGLGALLLATGLAVSFASLFLFWAI
jgi:hypothetical protein